jgi:hypothetical protein
MGGFANPANGWFRHTLADEMESPGYSIRPRRRAVATAAGRLATPSFS